MDRLSERLIALAKEDAYEHYCWLDGGIHQGGWFGVEADLEIRSQSLDGLAELESYWKEQPNQIWMGWISYDLGAAACMNRPPRHSNLPGMVMRRYAAAVQIREERPVQWFGQAPKNADLKSVIARAGPAESHDIVWPLAPMVANLDPQTYRQQILQAKEWIRRGETYQVNLSQPFEALWHAALSFKSIASRASQLYRDLRTRTPASMGALIRAEQDCWIVSNSPETLIQVERNRYGDVARTWPIKGTRPRAKDSKRDRQWREELLASEKDRAEHVMIVDLARNDLSKLARPHSVKAPTKPDLMTLPTVYHLCSEVSCLLSDDWNLCSLISAIFPGGSITGAPKKRSVELIDEIEGEARGIYCGAILVLHPGGLRASIPIRTGLATQRGLRIRSGGGIVADSDPDAELAETWTKMAAYSLSRGQG